MGRKSKLTEAQWAEIEKRMLAGEKIRALAREFKLGEATIRERLSAQVSETKTLANQIADTNARLSVLPISAQNHAVSLAAQLLSISHNLAGAAEYSARTANKLAGFANMKLETMTDENVKSHAEVLKESATLTALANEAARIPLNLLSANKDFIAEQGGKEAKESVAHKITTSDPVEAARVYAEIMKE